MKQIKKWEAKMWENGKERRESRGNGEIIRRHVQEERQKCVKGFGITEL